MGNASQINRSRNSVRVERRSDLNESDLGEVYCSLLLNTSMDEFYYCRQDFTHRYVSTEPQDDKEIKLKTGDSQLLVLTLHYDGIRVDCVFLNQL